MDFDPVLLARLQFAFTITFHIIFPSFTIGLSAFIATLLVRWIATGREHLHRLAAFWILSANSWMQPPAGYEVRDGIVYPLDWLAVIFNPSFPYRLAHMLTAAYLTTAFVVLAVGARYLVARRHEADGRTMVR